MTNDQLKLLHLAKRAVERLANGAFTDDVYRRGLVEMGRVTRLPPSAKDLAPAGFERVMAWFESMGWRDDRRPAEHWRTLVARRGRYSSPQQIRLIHHLWNKYVEAGGQLALDGFCRRMSHGRTTSVEDLNPGDAHKVIEAMKEMLRRHASPAVAAASPPSEEVAH
jgi:hypothetical protein